MLDRLHVTVRNQVPMRCHSRVTGKFGPQPQLAMDVQLQWAYTMSGKIVFLLRLAEEQLVRLTESSVHMRRDVLSRNVTACEVFGQSERLAAKIAGRIRSCWTF